MGNIRLHAISAATLMLVGCHSFPFEYVELTGDNIEVTETGQPPIRSRLGGDPIPIRYEFNEPGVSLSIAVGPKIGAPTMDIVSSVPIRAVSIEKGYAFRTSPFEYRVDWGLLDPQSSHVGDVVQIRIDLEDRVQPILISGVIAESGKIYSGPAL